VPFVHQHNSKLVAIWTAVDQQKQPDFALPSSLQSTAFHADPAIVAE
jgi:hypothetical protein